MIKIQLATNPTPQVASYDTTYKWSMILTLAFQVMLEQKVAPGGVPPPKQAVVVQSQEPLPASMLAAASPQEKKHMLGERFFPLIHHMFPDLAGKITGILIEIDNVELMNMLVDEKLLKDKVCCATEGYCIKDVCFPALQHPETS